MLNPVTHWEPGALVRYHGSLTDLHGMYRVHPCACLGCDDPALGTLRFQLVDEQGVVVVACVRPRSVTLVEELHDESDEHEECLGIHNGADGYRDCDGNPI